MHMDIPQKIETIIQRRKRQLPEIEAAIQRLEQARAVVERFDAYKSQLSGESSEFVDDLSAQLATVSTDDFYREYKNSLTELNLLKARFSREEVNISFVGKARQGKSLVLQRISGLEGDVIPSSDGTHCTGARSIISNDPNSEVTAKIDFYTEREYVDIVNTYIEEIFKGDIQPVFSAAEINRLNLKQMRSRIAYDQEALFERLEKYVNHVDEFLDKFGSQVTISKYKIESYVAQYSSKDHGRKYYTYLGVKQADIHAPFPCKQCGHIVLVDTIGAGDMALGIEKDMIAAVQNSDAIILVLCPNPGADIMFKDEYDLMPLIARAVTPEYAEKMLFWLMNRRETADYNNAHRIPKLIDDLKAKDNLPVAQYLNVNCWETEEVENNLLMPVLEQMSDHLDEIDQMIIDRTSKLLANLEQTYRKISSSMKRAAVASISEDVRREFSGEITNKRTGIRGRLFGSLQELFVQYEKRKDDNCEPLMQEADIKLKNILRILPGTEEILKLLKNGMYPVEVLIYFADMIRLKIVNDFLGLNELLDELVLKMKREAVHRLADTNIGGLKAVVDADPDNPVEWLERLRNDLDSRRFPMIRHALESLEDFNLRMENFLIYQVRCSLKPIDWLKGGSMPQLLTTDDLQELADDIQFHLRDNLEIIRQNVMKELDDYYSFPNTAMYAVLRDFWDRISRTCNEEGKEVANEWQVLYEDSIPELWPEKYHACNAQKKRSAEWNDLCDAIQSCAAVSYFRINRKDTF